MDVSEVDQKMESLKFLLQNDDHFSRLFDFSIQDHIYKIGYIITPELHICFPLLLEQKLRTKMIMITTTETTIVT